MDFFEFGSRPAQQDGSTLVADRARRILAAVRASRDFELFELRTLKTSQRGYDIVVVDCTNDQVPSKNRYGIKNRERIALAVPRSEASAPEARMLRRTFPRLPHVNQVPVGEPSHLCLHQESWTETRRNWTPERFLDRILWWLRQSAVGALHAPDQPIERLYFDFSTQLVLQRDAEQKLSPRPCRLFVEHSDNHSNMWVMRGELSRLGRYSAPTIATIIIRGDSVLHGRVEKHPTTLGQLDEQLTAHGLRLADQLRLSLAFYVTCNPRMLRTEMFMLIIDTHLRRAADQPIQKRETRAFFLHESSFIRLGEQLRVFGETDRGLEQGTLLAASARDPDWAATEIVPVDVRAIPSRAAARRASGLPDESGDEQRTLIGVGALGSALLELWTREGWGLWTIIDPDRVEAHNLVRHLAKASDIGKPKVTAVKDSMRATYNDDSVVEAIYTAASPAEPHAQADAAYVRSSLIVDVSTTLSVPRCCVAHPEAVKRVARCTPVGRS